MSSSFVWRRLHSLAGIFLVLFLIFHLITNSQAALWFGDNGIKFIHEVNLIHSLPYLVVIELVLLGVPFLIHMAWGVHYLFTAAPNSFATDGSKPALPEYYRNRAYTWQRLTSWILLVAVIAHVFQMRIYNYPASAQLGSEKSYMQRVEADPGLYTVAARLGVKIVDKEQIEKEKELALRGVSMPGDELREDYLSNPPQSAVPLLAKQREDQQLKWIEALEKRPLSQGEVIAIAPDFGTATLLLVRDIFKSPWMAVLYTIFVLAACFHAFNGLWTALITWGATLNPAAQRGSQFATLALMGLLTFLGLAAVWGTYFINLRT